MATETPPGDVVIHVPHSSSLVPPELRDQFTISDDRLAEIHSAMVDHDTDVMAAGVAQVVRFPLSRLVVDVERFWDEELEPMAQLGMGAVYRIDHQKRTLRRHLSRTEIDDLQEIYDQHHRELERAVDTALEQFGRCLIVDLHSYPHEKQPYEQADGPRPELCLGTDSFHTSEALISAAEAAARAHGLSTKRDSPFAGTLVPMKHYRRDNRVRSLMFEWRRDVYRHAGASLPSSLDKIRSVIATVITTQGSSNGAP